MQPLALYIDDIAPGRDDRLARANLSRRIAEIGILARAATRDSSASNPLDVLAIPALLLDLDGCVVGQNAAAVRSNDDDLNVRQRRIHLRDNEARSKLRSLIDQLEHDGTRSTATDPIIVPRHGGLPALLRGWPIDAACRWPSPDVRVLLTLAALGPRLGPPPAILAKVFSLTPSEAKLASIIARGAGPDAAAAELAISRETARNQLKSIFAKTGTHRQGELVALLLQV